MKKIYILAILTISLLASCNKESSNTVAISSDATVASLYFTAVDSMPGLAAATFVIEDGIDTGKIYNIDSIHYGTKVDKVIPVFSFNATPGAAIVYTPFDTTTLTLGDTVNFTHNPTKLQVIASDNTTEKWYNIYVHVHQVDPDLFVWEELNSNIYPTEGAECKLVVLSDIFYIFVNNGLTTHVYQSNNARDWDEVSLSGLPDDCYVRNIIPANDVLYYAIGNTLYQSSNGTDWNATDFSTADFQFVNMLFSFNDSIWAITEKGHNYHLATSKDGTEWRLHEVLPTDFPISDFAAVPFISASNRPRAMVVGGFSSSGASLNTRWNVEYTLEKGYRWTNFSIEQPSFKELTGIDIVWYNKRFYLFGGVDKDNQIGAYPILESIDEGMNWSVPDSAHNCLPSTYELRTKPSVIIDSDSAIYIAGGQSRTDIFSDIHRGRLNSIDW